MFDIVFPNKNEREFIQMAERLGYKGIIFIYKDKKEFYTKNSNITIVNAMLVPANKIQKAKSANALAICEAVDIRPAIEAGADIVFGMEHEQRREKTHYRRSGLNQVLCKLANRKKVAIGFSFNAILSAKNSERVKLMGRMMQNIRICRKFKTSVRIASFAKSPYDMRSPDDLAAFFSQLGLTNSKAAMSKIMG